MCLFSVKRNHRIISTPRVSLSIYLSIYLSPVLQFSRRLPDDHTAAASRRDGHRITSHAASFTIGFGARTTSRLRKAASVPHGNLSRRTGCRPA